MAEHVDVLPSEVHEILGRHVLTDGMKLVVDLKRSRGSRLVDARNGKRYLDMYTFFASAPLGINPPGIVDDPTFMAELAEIAANKPANPDMYTTAYAEFVETFVRVLGDPALPHLFFIEGGALAVENALKVAFDWKSRQNEAAGRDRQTRHQDHAPDQGLPRPERLYAVADQHGAEQDRSVSRSSTGRGSTCRRSPSRSHDHLDEVVAAEQRALEQARRAFADAPRRHRRLHRRADPGRGRRQPHPARVLRRRCSRSFMITTRCSSSTRCRPASAPPARPGPTSSWASSPTSSPSPRRPRWAASWPAAGSTRCRTTCSGCPGGSTRPGAAVSSTWSGRGRILEIIESDSLIEAAGPKGRRLVAGLEGISAETGRISNVRGRGLFVACDLPTPAERDALVVRPPQDRAGDRAALRRTVGPVPARAVGERG